ncbi:MAG: riboflavin biosynthesis protein RibF [Acidobacteriaceae bacterium]|nr:riboflavin biosynthesis protein RibF [Acidobacteriaceae bacterium]
MKATAFRSLEDARGRFGPCALAIGNFDGVHLGHQALMREMVAYANANGLIPAVLTFHPHPAAIVAPERIPELICPLDERENLLASAGAKQILVLPFTSEVARLQPEEFVSQILTDALETGAVFVGENFRFGYQQAGTPEILEALGRQRGFASHFLKPVTSRGEVVSSSLIRRYLARGNVSRAGRLLGRCFSLSGDIVAGHGIGTKQTVPTLNLRPTPGQLTPRGVYITETISFPEDRRWPSITNVGLRPTFGGDELTIETFLLRPLDGGTPQHIEVQFRRFVREERQFPNPAELKSQIMRDVSRAQSYWRRVAKSAQPAPSIY